MFIFLTISSCLSMKTTIKKINAIKMNVPGIVAQKLEYHGKNSKALMPVLTGIETEPKDKTSLKIKSKNKNSEKNPE